MRPRAHVACVRARLASAPTRPSPVAFADYDVIIATGARPPSRASRPGPACSLAQSGRRANAARELTNAPRVAIGGRVHRPEVGPSPPHRYGPAKPAPSASPDRGRVSEMVRHHPTTAWTFARGHRTGFGTALAGALSDGSRRRDVVVVGACGSPEHGVLMAAVSCSTTASSATRIREPAMVCVAGTAGRPVAGFAANEH
jgi:hypothetical protein